MPDQTSVTSVTGSESSEAELRLRPLYIVTPTYTRPTQLPGEPLDQSEGFILTTDQ